MKLKIGLSTNERPNIGREFWNRTDLSTLMGT